MDEVLEIPRRWMDKLRKRRPEPPPEPKTWEQERVLELLAEGGDAEVLVDEAPKNLVPSEEIKAEALSDLPTHSVLNAPKPMPGARSRYLVKTEAGWMSDFITHGYIESGDLAQLDEQRRQRWEALVKLGWPVIVWHGTSAGELQDVKASGKHFLVLSETFTDSPGYADGRGMGVLAYALPANDLRVTPSLGARKIGVNTSETTPYIDQDEFGKYGLRPFLDLRHQLTYPRSNELQEYLRASNITYEVTADGENILVPLFQRTYEGEGKFSELDPEANQAVPRDRMARTWRSDLYGPEVMVFKDGASIRVRPKPIPVPEGQLE
jgi:hypothetical protein